MTRTKSVMLSLAAGLALLAPAARAGDVSQDKAKAEVSQKGDATVRAASPAVCTCDASHGNVRQAPPGTDPEIDRLRTQGG